MPKRGSDGKFIKEEENFDLSLPHPFTIIKYLIIFRVAFPWYKFITKTDLLDLFYNKVVDCPQCPQCPKLDCSSCPTEKEVIIGHCKPCKPCDKECKPCEKKVCPPCNLVCKDNKCPDTEPCPVCEKCDKKEEKENLNLEEG